jgi:hypothetical protein
VLDAGLFVGFISWADDRCGRPPPPPTIEFPRLADVYNWVNFKCVANNKVQWQMNSDIPSSPDVEFLDGNKRENHGLPYGQQHHITKT